LFACTCIDLVKSIFTNKDSTTPMFVDLCIMHKAHLVWRNLALDFVHRMTRDRPLGACFALYSRRGTSNFEWSNKNFAQYCILQKVNKIKPKRFSVYFYHMQKETIEISLTAKSFFLNIYWNNNYAVIKISLMAKVSFQIYLSHTFAS